jgi:hypothetical protein
MHETTRAPAPTAPEAAPANVHPLLPSALFAPTDTFGELSSCPECQACRSYCLPRTFYQSPRPLE